MPPRPSHRGGTRKRTRHITKGHTTRARQISPHNRDLIRRRALAIVKTTPASQEHHQ